MAPPPTTGGAGHATRHAPAAPQPLRIAARAQSGALGRPELVVEVKYLTWTDDNLLRQVVYEGLREDKPPADARRPIPHPQPPQ